MRGRRLAVGNSSLPGTARVDNQAHSSRGLHYTYLSRCVVRLHGSEVTCWEPRCRTSKALESLSSVSLQQDHQYLAAKNSERRVL
jgi:hypothetical protein